ncbi:MAG: cytochrome c biogenesis protein CcdA [Thermomicrobia bacterium]|nr:cytochrome c biogenesis protein CcdA [Thermomicrobia bacterium]
MDLVLAVRVQNTPLIVGIPLAFLGGLLSFVSPCVLPLVPGYIGYLAGTSVAGTDVPRRRTLLLNGLAFVLGFSAVFTLVGIAIGQVLTSVQSAQGYVRWVGGVVVILLGFHMLGLIRIPFLNRIFFAAGWSPCVGPILTGIYGVVGSQPANGGLLLFIYSLGLGVPFLCVALLFGTASGTLRRVNRYYGVISIVSGLFLIAIGVLLLTDTFTRLAQYAPVMSLPGVS